MMWKLLTGVIADGIYHYLDKNQLLPGEQKGCHRRGKGTKDQLLIDKAILMDCRKRHTNMAITWIDYKKTYDMVHIVGLLNAWRCFGLQIMSKSF